MKSRRLDLVKENGSCIGLSPSSTPFSHKALANSTSLSSAPHFAAVRNNNNSSSLTHTPSSNLKVHWDSSLAVVLVVFMSAFTLLGFFSIYAPHIMDEDETATRGEGRNGRMRRRASQGLDSTTIGTLPMFKYSLMKGLKQGKEALECAVCLSEFEEEETLRLLPKCRHSFHPDCIDMWLFSHTTCPLCRTSLSTQSHTLEQQMTLHGRTLQAPLEVGEHVVVDVGAVNGVQGS